MLLCKNKIKRIRYERIDDSEKNMKKARAVVRLIRYASDDDSYGKMKSGDQ